MLKNNDSKNYVPISNIVDIYLGGTPSRAESKYWGQGIKWASATDIATCESRYLRKTKEQITELGLQKSAAKLLGKNTVLITARGTVGALCMLPEPMSFNQTCYGLVCHYELDPTYLYFALKARIQHIKSQTYGAVFDTITIKSFDFITIPLPTLSTQRKIAAILSAYDDLIENNTRRIKILEEMAQTLYRHWFVNFKFPGHEEVRMVDSGTDASTALSTRLGMVPEGWSVVKLGEVADVSWGDTSVTKKSYVQDGFTAYSASGPDGYLDYYDYDRKGVVLSAIGANCGITWFAQGKWSCIKNTIRFWATSDSVDTEFLYFATFGKDYWPKRGAAQPFISQTDAQDVKILLPSTEVLRLFTNVVSSILLHIDLLIRKNDVLHNTRDLLLPKLVSGELDVSELNISGIE